MKTALKWSLSDDDYNTLEASVDGAYPMQVRPNADDGYVGWQVWITPLDDDRYELGTEPTVEQAQRAAEACALAHARGVVARLERKP